jgi:hypothetical protein
MSIYSFGLLFLPAVFALAPACIARTAPDPHTATVEQHEVFEITLKTAEEFGNPFTEARLTAEFQAPGGAKVSVPGFYYGGTTWMVRFVPNKVGQWSYRASLAGRKSVARQSGSFRSIPSKRSGFVRISRRNPYRFEFENGRPFYPIGVQTCGYFQVDFDGPNEDGSWRIVPAQTWIKEFQGASNLMRWQLGAGTKDGCALPLIPIDGAPGRYDTELARKMDELLALQRAHGFAHIMVPFQDMSLWGKRSTAFGAVDDLKGYKSLQAPNLPLQEAYLRYIVARFGAFVDIWELFNEDSYAPNDYLAHLAAVVREADPYDHPITTNYTRSAEDWCELVTWHGYMGIPAEAVDAWVADLAGRHKHHRKPVLSTEFGNKGLYSNVDPVKWRIAAWTAYMSESNVLFWAMSGTRTTPGRRGNANAYLGPDSRRHLRTLNEFTRDLPVDMRPVECTYGYHEAIRFYALSNGKTSVVYAHHFADHSAPYTFPGRVYVHTGAGSFRITWIDPADGKVVKTGRAESRGQYVFFEMPPVTIDLACRIDRAN